MDFADSPEEASFREELRSWLATNTPDLGDIETDSASADLTASRAWSRKLHEAGYAGLTWPKEHGGGGQPAVLQGIYLEELVRAQAPQHINVIGLGMAGPTLISRGSEEQKQRFLSTLLSGDEVWCQGFSEPGAGSDLAAVRTRAELDGDHWVVNGQKVWSSWAHIASWCILLVRTDPLSTGHAGLSFLLLDMSTPGVEVRPLRQLTGDPEFNEIFFDDVRVPVTSMIGAAGEGWSVAMTTLLHERGTMGVSMVAQLQSVLGKLTALATRASPAGAAPIDDPLVQDRLARELIELEALRGTAWQGLSIAGGAVPGPEGSIVKLRWSESVQRASRIAFDILGTDALNDGSYWRYLQLRSRGNTIEAGTSEVLRGIIAERVLGLPRSR